MKLYNILFQSNGLKRAFLLLLFSTTFSLINAQSDYYWSDNHKIDLKEDRTSIVVQFKEGSLFESYFKVQNPIISSVEIHSAKNRAVVRFKTRQDLSLKQLIKNLGIESSEYVSAAFGFKLDDGFQIWPTHQIELSLRKDAKMSEINAILQKYKARTIYSNKNRLSLRISEINQALALSNELYENNSVEWAHPDFYATIRHAFTPSDTYYGNQFQMNNSNDVDCDAPEAWDITTGASSIKVAVIDDGVETHPDLTNLNTSIGYTPANNGNGLPNSSGAHGVACAGIIGATHNNIGVAGIAPDVEMFSVNIFYGGESSADLANAITYSKNQGASVLSNSWGFPSCTYSADVLNSALADAKNNGRNGKGCVIVFASGNDYGSCVSYPGNNPNVIAVGAITNTGNRSSYSNQGSKLDISAPSSGGSLGVYTTDRQGSSGYASGSYTSTFGGTSAACPLVSGVAALVLSIDNALTSSQVQSILETSSTDMGASGFDVEFGHGRVNAHQAALAAGGTTGGGGGGGGTPACVESNISFNLLTDNYGSETTWSLTDANGTQLYSGSGYNNNQTYNFNWTLADGNYTFTINDSYGDGMCCSYGQGSYDLSDGTVTIKSGGSFASVETTDFCVSSSGSGGGSDPCPIVDLSAVTVNSYGGSQDNGTSSINTSSDYVFISNNAWKSIDYNYTVTANTIIEFDFGSTSQGEIHGIGFDNNNGISSNYTFRLYGTQNWGIGDFDDYASSAGSWKSYAIPVGQFYTGTFDRLFFVCDDDANSGGNSYFSNIKIYEGSCASSNYMPSLFNNFEGIYGDEGEEEMETSAIVLYPNPAYDKLNIQVENTEKWSEIIIIDATGRLVWTGVFSNRSQIDVSGFSPGMYNVTLYRKDGTYYQSNFVKEL
jgi:subtilisin family serine protease